MKYKPGPLFPYVDDKDYYVTPDGEVKFLNQKLPEEVRKRLKEDVHKMRNERLHPEKPLHFS